MTAEEREKIALTPCANRHLGVAISPQIRDNQGVQLARRGFLRLISALPAFAVFRSLPVQAAPDLAPMPTPSHAWLEQWRADAPDRTFESIRDQCRAIVRQYPDSKVIGMGSAAINCYEAGLIAEHGGRVEVGDTTRPYIFGYKRVVFVPSLGPWDVAAEADLETVQKWWPKA